MQGLGRAKDRENYHLSNLQPSTTPDIVQGACPYLEHLLGPCIDRGSIGIRTLFQVQLRCTKPRRILLSAYLSLWVSEGLE